MTKLSIVIPVYNLEDCIENCLKSILNQPFKDFEIICVNDGSSDNSAEIIRNIKDNRIMLINKVNEGSGIARNVGLANSSGEYVFFIDGDDGLEENSLEKIIKEAQKLQTDILVFGGLSYYGEKGRKGGYSADKLPKIKGVFSCEDIKKQIFKFPATPWSKLYKRSFLIENDIKFQNLRAGQDQLPFFHSMITAKRIAILPENLYRYTKNRKGSVTSAKKKKNSSPIHVFYAIENLLIKLGKLDEYRDIFVDRYFSKATSWLAKFDDEKKAEYFEEYLKLLHHIQDDYGLWRRFKPDINDCYFRLKLKQIFR